MKKYLSIFLVSLFLLFPFVVRAEGEEGETENEVVSISSINLKLLFSCQKSCRLLDLAIFCNTVSPWCPNGACPMS